MRTHELKLSANELRDAARVLDDEALSLTVDKDAILNAYRVMMFAVQRTAHGCGFDCVSTGIDEWEIKKR